MEDELDEHISHDDVATVDGGCARTRINDDASNTELVEVITDATIEGLPPIIPEYQHIIRECLDDVCSITNPKSWQIILIQLMVFDRC